MSDTFFLLGASGFDIRSITADTTAGRVTFGWSPMALDDEGLHRTWQ
ncbi:hypothetical protein [Lysobacter niastensis]|uniref:Uncharacterized protein n=1 Tax=Lysobacter niastensis TaxID=380629 RepID=A0ABS0BD35_9GAMM|nr:hypothetical protein [Lysobacter niastensis]MBF6025867.1 hypothetical protein [Lysobacter niastensis]